MAEATPGGVTLPHVVLRGRSVPSEVLRIIGKETALKYKVVAFEQTDSRIRLAVVYPQQLKQGFYDALNNIGERLHRTIEVFQTDSASFDEIVRQYDKPSTKPAIESSTWPPGPPPPLFELGKVVAYNYLKRVPIDYAKKHRFVCVDYVKPNHYWFVTDGTNDADVAKIISSMQASNDISATMIVISPQDFNDLMAYYADLDKREVKEEANEVVDVEGVSSDKPESAASGSAATPPTQDVVVPEIQAEIITGEPEKKGLAGLFQKVTQNFAAQDIDKNHDPSFGRTDADLPAPVQVEGVETPPNVLPPKIDVGRSDAPMVTPEVLQTSEKKEDGTDDAPVAQTTAVQTVTKKAAIEEKKRERAEMDDSDLGKALRSHVLTLDQLKEQMRTGVIPVMVAAIVSFAIHERASDIHIEAYDDEVRVRYRIDGQLIDIVRLPPDIHSPIVSRIKILSRLRLDENRIPQDGRFDVNFEDVQVDLRISVMPTVHGEKVVLRILDKSRSITSLEKLGIEGVAYDNFTTAIQKPFGIVLATGPTGSGKSTTLYAILNRIATPNVNVVTLEDPIEYEIKGVNQSQIRPKIGYTFAEGLRSILRQDPNIIMVGEIRDGETANMATQAALTGHLVLSTLHTNDAAGAIPRLMNMGIEPFLITSSVNVVLGQRLVRRICPSCRSEVSIPPGLRDQLEKEVEAIATVNSADAKRIKKPLRFYQGVGCKECRGKGYQGRMGIYEVLIMTPEIEELTIARASTQDIQKEAIKQGMLTMYQDGLLKVINGQTTLDEILRETSNK